MSDRDVPVYVVDDDASVREAVGSLIRSAGLRSETFTSAQEFLASTRAEVPSCLVLDVELPGLSGLDLQQELAKADVQIPIIFLTGRANIPMSVRAMKAGALDFLTKPVDDEVLLNTIRKGIAHYQTPRQQLRGTSPSLAAIDHVRLEERVKERTRIARELHDTLVQSFYGLLARFQTAHNLLPGRAAEAMHVLESALHDATLAVTEARDAVHGLRSSAVVTTDLANALNVLGGELARCQGTEHGNVAAFSVLVEGTSQDLHPILRDEVFRIAAEALRNAFHHARARRIEVHILYAARQLRVRVRDNGIGIDARALGQEGCAGHWGLRGMIERAQCIGGQLEIWTKLGAGTEVELTVPSVAHQALTSPHFRLFTARRISGNLAPRAKEWGQVEKRKGFWQ